MNIINPICRGVIIFYYVFWNAIRCDEEIILIGFIFHPDKTLVVHLLNTTQNITLMISNGLQINMRNEKHAMWFKNLAFQNKPCAEKIKCILLTLFQFSYFMLEEVIVQIAILYVYSEKQYNFPLLSQFFAPWKWFSNRAQVKHNLFYISYYQ